MIENEQLVGKISGKARRLFVLAGEDHQIKREAEPAETSEAGSPDGIGHEIAARGEASGGVRGPAEDVADADDARERRLGFEKRRRIATSERNVGDVSRGDAAALVERLQPRCLANAVVFFPARFDMNCGNDVLPRCIAAIVRRQIVAPERRQVAEPPF